MNINFIIDQLPTQLIAVRSTIDHYNLIIPCKCTMNYNFYNDNWINVVQLIYNVATTCTMLIISQLTSYVATATYIAMYIEQNFENQQVVGMQYHF